MWLLLLKKYWVPFFSMISEQPPIKMELRCLACALLINIIVCVGKKSLFERKMVDIISSFFSLF